MITLLDYFTFAEADGGSGVYTPWIAFPSEYQTAEYWIDGKLYHSGSVDLTLQSSVDGEAEQTVDGPTTVSAAGLTRTEVTEKLGSMVRLKLQESGGAGGIHPRALRLVGAEDGLVAGGAGARATRARLHNWGRERNDRRETSADRHAWPDGVDSGAEGEYVQTLLAWA